MSQTPPSLGLAFCSGGLAGQVISAAAEQIHVGRSSDNEICLTQQDVTVSGRHATFEYRESVWTVSDAGSQTGTFIPGKQIHVGEHQIIRPGDWILFGAGGSAAIVLEPGASAPETWLVLEPENDPSGFIGVINNSDIEVSVGENSVLHYPARKSAKHGYRFRLDRTPVTAVTLGEGNGASVSVESDDILKLEPGHAGIRVLGVRGTGGASKMGDTSIRQAIRQEIGRQRALPYLLVVVVILIAIAVTTLVIESRDRQHQRSRARLERERMKMQQELTLLEKEFGHTVDQQQEEFETALKTQQEAFDTELERREEETSKQLEAMKVSDRDKFAAVVEKYKKSVLLIYTAEHIVTKDGKKYMIAAGWGSGWIVRSNGMVVTNKHVAESWKYDEKSKALLKTIPGAHIEVDYYAWPAGERFLASDNKSPNEDTGYNTTKLKNLQFLGSVPDDSGIAKEYELNGTKMSVQVQESDDSDLAILQLTGDSFTPIPVKRDPENVKALDPVLLLGFPLGGKILDAGRAYVSGSLGTVRFVSGVVNHTASGFGGNSGGPLLTLDGEVVGIHTRGWGETLKSAIRSDVLLKYMERYP